MIAESVAEVTEGAAEKAEESCISSSSINIDKSGNQDQLLGQ